MVQVCFLSGELVPVSIIGDESLSELRAKVAMVLRAPSFDNVEFLDDAGERLEEVDSIADLGDMKIQAFLFGLDDEPTASDEELYAAPHLADSNIPYEEYKKSGGYSVPDAEAADLNTTSSSLQADSPSISLPLHEAVSLGDHETVVQLLADGFDVGLSDSEGDTALHRAAYQSRQDLTMVLLQARADPNAFDRKRKTPLRKAYDNKDVTEALLSARADPNLADKNGNTTLHRTAEDDHVDVAELLLAASADPNMLNDDDLSPLHSAAIFGKVSVAQLLLGAGADINAKGADGNTALHFAAYSGREEVGKVLLQAGADLHICNEDGETPFEHANTGDHEAPSWLAQ